MYKIEKNLNRLYRKEATFFLDPKEQLELAKKLKKEPYQIYKPYPDSEKNIFYIKEEPKVILYKIKSKIPLEHREILGTLFSLNITSELFGDIVITNNHYYIYVLESIAPYIKNNLLLIKNSHVELIEVPLETLKEYHKEYETIEIIASSTRIDTVISRLIQTSRPNIIEKIKNKEIILNYDILKNNSYQLKENDIFSIRRYGKYQYIGIKKETKSKNYIIECKKYK